MGGKRHNENAQQRREDFEAQDDRSSSSEQVLNKPFERASASVINNRRIVRSRDKWVKKRSVLKNVHASLIGCHSDLRSFLLQIPWVRFSKGIFECLRQCQNDDRGPRTVLGNVEPVCECETGASKPVIEPHIGSPKV